MVVVVVVEVSRRKGCSVGGRGCSGSSNVGGVGNVGGRGCSGTGTGSLRKGVGRAPSPSVMSSDHLMICGGTVSGMKALNKAAWQGMEGHIGQTGKVKEGNRR